MSSTLTYEGDNAPIDLDDPKVPIDLSDDPHTLLFSAVKELGDKLAEDQQHAVATAIKVAGRGARPRDMPFADLLYLYGSLRLLEEV